MANKETCPDYRCEYSTEYGEHTHVGVQPYLRRVVDQSGRVVDGKTGEVYSGASEEVER